MALPTALPLLVYLQFNSNKHTSLEIKMSWFCVLLATQTQVVHHCLELFSQKGRPDMRGTIPSDSELPCPISQTLSLPQVWEKSNT